MLVVKTIMQPQLNEGMNLNINIEFKEFGSFVFRETLAESHQESILPGEESISPEITLPSASTQGGEKLLFGPALLTFA